MSHRYTFLAILLLVIGLGATTSVIANPTCDCDVLCSRFEQRCLDFGGTLDECADIYDSCFITCGDPWPCGSTTAAVTSPADSTQESGQKWLGLETPSWWTPPSHIVLDGDTAEKAVPTVEAQPVAAQQAD